MSEQQNMEGVEALTEEQINIQKIKLNMEGTANDLAKATDSKVVILFYNNPLKKMGIFTSSDVSELEQRGLIASANN